MSLASPSNFFANRRNPRDIIDGSKPTISKKAPSKPVTAAPVTPDRTTNTDASSTTSESQMSSIVNMETLRPLPARPASQIQSLQPGHILANSAELPDMQLQQSFDESKRPSGVEGKERMSMQSRLWVVEDTMEKRFVRIESQLNAIMKVISLKGEAPPTPPVDEMVPASKATQQAWTFKELADPKVNWVPLGVRSMKPLDNGFLKPDMQPLQLEKLKPFTHSFLTHFLGGIEYSPGMYHGASGAWIHSKDMGSRVPSKTYYLLNATVDPFLPKVPGEHGAKLALIMRELESDAMAINVPLFMAMPGQAANKEKEYIYMGHYTQTRWSDRLDYDRVVEVVSDKAKDYWAEMVTAKTRPQWMVEELMSALCPKPIYSGAISTHGNGDSGEGPDETGFDGNERIRKDMGEFGEDLEDWAKEAKELVEGLTKESCLKSFGRADAAEHPGLRFWWEYLQCVGFDKTFYYILNTAFEKRGSLSR